VSAYWGVMYQPKVPDGAGFFDMKDYTKVILEALESHGESGCGVISLSLETDISQDSLRSFFKENKKYCLPIDGHKFKLNRLTEENGSVDKIIATIKQNKSEQHVKDRVARAFLWGLMLGIGLPMVIDWLLYLYNWLF
jgi:hypothetical protein